MENKSSAWSKGALTVLFPCQVWFSFIISTLKIKMSRWHFVFHHHNTDCSKHVNSSQICPFKLTANTLSYFFLIREYPDNQFLTCSVFVFRLQWHCLFLLVLSCSPSFGVLYIEDVFHILLGMYNCLLHSILASTIASCCHSWGAEIPFRSAKFKQYAKTSLRVLVFLSYVLFPDNPKWDGLQTNDGLIPLHYWFTVLVMSV